MYQWNWLVQAQNKVKQLTNIQLWTLWDLITHQFLPSTYHSAVISKCQEKWKMGNKNKNIRPELVMISTVCSDKYYIILIGAYRYANNNMELS